MYGTGVYAPVYGSQGYYVPGYIIPERVQDEMILASLELSKEQAKTAEQFQRASLELQKKEAALSMSYEVRENAEAEHILSEISLELENDKVVLKIIGTNGRVRRKITVIDATFLSAMKIVSTYPERKGVMCVNFRKDGQNISFFYVITRVQGKTENILDVIRKTSLNMKSSRRLDVELREQLPKLFYEIAKSISLPYDLGYYLDESGVWQLCKPGEATMNSLLRKVVSSDG